MWQHFSHQSDIGIKAEAEIISRAFEDAAMALTAIVTDPSNVETVQPVNFDVVGENEEDLFFHFMSKIIYEMDVLKMLFGRYEVKIEDLRLTAIAWGEKVNFERHSPAVEPKAVTLNQLSVKEENGKWICQCVVDV
jgi:tRNA nucleotidyltransferase (CCA-adding enzyme)